MKRSRPTTSRWLWGQSPKLDWPEGGRHRPTNDRSDRDTASRVKDVGSELPTSRLSVRWPYSIFTFSTE